MAGYEGAVSVTIASGSSGRTAENVLVEHHVGTHYLESPWLDRPPIHFDQHCHYQPRNDDAEEDERDGSPFGDLEDYRCQ